MTSCCLVFNAIPGPTPAKVHGQDVVAELLQSRRRRRELTSTGPRLVKQDDDGGLASDSRMEIGANHRAIG